MAESNRPPETGKMTLLNVPADFGSRFFLVLLGTILPVGIFLAVKAELFGIYALAAIIGIFFASMSIIFPKVWAYSTILLLPLYLISRDTDVNPMEIVVYSYLFSGIMLWFISEVFIHRRKVVYNFGDFCIILFLVFAFFNIIIALLNNTELLAWFKEYTVYCLYLLYFPYRKFFRTDDDVRKVITCLALSLIIISLYQLYHFKTLIVMATFAYELQSTLRINLTLLSFGAVLAILSIFRYKGKFFKIYMLLLAILCAGIVTTSFARTTWIIELGLIGAILFILNRRQKIVALTIAGISALAIVITLVSMLSNFDVYLGMLNKKFLSTGDGKKDPSVRARIVEYSSVWKSIEQNPISGNGIGKKFAHKNILANGNPVMRKSFIHNSFLQLWYCLGIPTAIPIVLFLLFYYLKSIMLTFFHGRKPNIAYCFYQFLAFSGLTIALSHAMVSPQLVAKETIILIVFSCWLCNLAMKKETTMPLLKS